ncbi:MAG: phenylalanine--tRNA ligase subunit beta, partial [Candidatus Saccharimonadales bacterium]
YKDAVIVRVVECEKHPNADKLSVCKIDIGENSPYSIRQLADQNPKSTDLIQVVCGAPNVHADMWAVWLPPGATVPATYGDKDPFVLDVRDIRGVKSHGMLAAADELGIGSDHAGIIELTESDLTPFQGPSLKSRTPNSETLTPGLSFAETFGLSDTIIDIENKMFTHRPDLFGQLGVAREISGIFGHAFTSPEWYVGTESERARERESEGLQLKVFNEAPEVVPRFMAVALRDVTVRPSPMWLQCELVRMGSKPINNIVDATNYMMLVTAQPTHAYDYDKLRGRKLGVRMANNGEKVALLNSKTYELTTDDIVIVDGEGPVGLAGIMGGNNSEVSTDTKNIVLEVANFDMYAVRRSSMRHGVFTDALTRFNKGQSPLQNEVVMHELMQLVTRVAGGEQASEVHDEKHLVDSKWNMAIDIDSNFINDRLGLKLNGDEIIKLLTNVEFSFQNPKSNIQNLLIAAPFWRTDIEQPEDIVEEVGRLYGFDKLPRELPQRSVAPVAKNPLREMKRRIRDNLRRAGANEVLTYSFVHERTLKNAGQDSAHAFRLSNALSPDLQYYRLSLTPSLLDKIHMNIKSGHDQFALFEIGKSHFKGEMDANEPNVPNEDTHIACVFAANDKQLIQGSEYYYAKRYLETILTTTDSALTPLKDFDLSGDAWGSQLVAPYEPSRTAVIVRDGQIWGVIGEFTATAKQAFKLPRYAAGFEIHIDVVNHDSVIYTPLSRYPSVTQDISLKVAHDVTYEQIFWCVHDAIAGNDKESCVLTITPLSIYQSSEDTEHKTITLRIEMTSPDRTLTDAEVTELLQRAAQAAADTYSAQVV